MPYRRIGRACGCLRCVWYDSRQLQFVPKPSLSEVSGAQSRRVDAGTHRRTVARTLFSCGVYFARQAQCFGNAASENGVRMFVLIGVGNFTNVFCQPGVFTPFCPAYLAARFCAHPPLRHTRRHVEKRAVAQTAKAVGRKTAIAKSRKRNMAAPLSTLQIRHVGNNRYFLGTSATGRLASRASFAFLLKQRAGELMSIFQGNRVEKT